LDRRYTLIPKIQSLIFAKHALDRSCLWGNPMDSLVGNDSGNINSDELENSRLVTGESVIPSAKIALSDIYPNRNKGKHASHD
jgi:hypothetical protein